MFKRDIRNIQHDATAHRTGLYDCYGCEYESEALGWNSYPLSIRIILTGKEVLTRKVFAYRQDREYKRRLGGSPF